MSIIQIQPFGYSDESLTNYINNIDDFKKGFYCLNFTEMKSLLKPVIIAGSSIEINGNIYLFNSNENISGSPSAGECYVKCEIISNEVFASFTNTAPAFNNSLQGWYGTGGGSTDRYVLKLYFNGASEYRLKQKIDKWRYWQYEV